MHVVHVLLQPRLLEGRPAREGEHVKTPPFRRLANLTRFSRGGSGQRERDDPALMVAAMKTTPTIRRSGVAPVLPVFVDTEQLHTMSPTGGRARKTTGACHRLVANTITPSNRAKKIDETLRDAIIAETAGSRGEPVSDGTDAPGVSRVSASAGTAMRYDADTKKKKKKKNRKKSSSRIRLPGGTRMSQLRNPPSMYT